MKGKFKVTILGIILVVIFLGLNYYIRTTNYSLAESSQVHQDLIQQILQDET